MTKEEIEKEIEKYEERQWQLDLIEKRDKGINKKYDYYTKKINELKKILKEIKE